jgi:hypothetical protein
MERLDAFQKDREGLKGRVWEAEKVGRAAGGWSVHQHQGTAELPRQGRPSGLILS